VARGAADGARPVRAGAAGAHPPRSRAGAGRPHRAAGVHARRDVAAPRREQPARPLRLERAPLRPRRRRGAPGELHAGEARRGLLRLPPRSRAAGAVPRHGGRTVTTTFDVLTDVPGKPGRFWGDHTTLVGPSRPPAWLLRLCGRRWADNLAGMTAALRMFLRRGQCQGVVTDGGASGILFAWLQVLFPGGRKPHVMVDRNWYLSGGRLRDAMKRGRLRLAARSVHRFAVWASHEVDDYREAFGLPREKLVYVPFHGTLTDYEYAVRDDGYLFAGGNYDPDYATLIDAVPP